MMNNTWTSRILVPGLLSLAIVSLAAAQTPTSGSLTVDPSQQSGLHSSGRLLIFAPNPVQPGSSISHLDTTAFPNLLMEPGISNDLPPLGTDLTVSALRDIGWSAGTSNFSISFTDAAGQGFNDPALGSQRRNAFQQAVNVFAGLIRSSVTINVDARFQSLTCSSTAGATLAQASPSFVFTVAGSTFPQSWYPGPLAEALTGQNLSTSNNPDVNAGDIRVTFNNQIDNDCLGPGRSFFYGTGEEADGQSHFINVALHEIGHGLGFLTFINSTTGQQFNGRPDAYSHFLRDTVFRNDWAALTPGQIRTSAVRSGRLIWRGSRANQEARSLLDPQPVFTVLEPSSIAGSFEAGLAQFGPRVADTMPVAELTPARDDSASPSLLCGPVKNRATVNGRIAIVDRGDCTFVSKVLNAQDAGAVGVLIVNNTAGIVTMGGDDPAVQIPSLSVSPEDGATIRAAVANPVDDPDNGGGGGGGGPPPPPPPPPTTTDGVDGPPRYSQHVQRRRDNRLPAERPLQGSDRVFHQRSKQRTSYSPPLNS